MITTQKEIFWGPKLHLGSERSLRPSLNSYAIIHFTNGYEWKVLETEKHIKLDIFIHLHLKKIIIIIYFTELFKIKQKIEEIAIMLETGRWALISNRKSCDQI